MSEEFWWVITSILGLLVIVAGWALGTLYTSKSSKTAEMEKEIKEIKENYLDRFQKVNDNIASSKAEIIEKLHKLELSMDAAVAANLIKETAIAVAAALKERK